MDYKVIPNGEAYGLVSSGGLILVCTISAQGVYDLAPVAWNTSLDYEPASRVLFVLDPGHLSFENIESCGNFAIALPSVSQKALVEAAGSVSGRKGDKYLEFSIPSFNARRVDARIPEGVAGWLKCRLLKVVSLDNARVVMAEVLHAEAITETWKERLYYAGNSGFFQAGASV